MEHFVTDFQVDDLKRELTTVENTISSLARGLQGLQVTPESVCELADLEGYRDGIEYALKALGLK